MEEILRSHLKMLADRLETVGVTPATLGKRALNDNTFFGRLFEESSTFNVRTYDRVVSWCDGNWPEGVDWPTDVPRPESVPSQPEQAA